MASSSSYAPPISSGENAPSILSETFRLVGNLITDGDIHIDGKVEGDVRANVLTIGPKGVIVGKIFADHLRVSGRVIGDITGRIVELYGHAHIEGNILHETLAIEAGSHIDGLCRQGEIMPLLESPDAIVGHVTDVDIVSEIGKPKKKARR